MGTNCASLEADLFSFCYERDFMKSFFLMIVKPILLKNSSKLQDSWTLFQSLHFDNSYCECLVNQIYPPELQLNKANASDTEAPFLSPGF